MEPLVPQIFAQGAVFNRIVHSRLQHYYWNFFFIIKEPVLLRTMPPQRLQLFTLTMLPSLAKIIAQKGIMDDEIQLHGSHPVQKPQSLYSYVLMRL